MQDQQTIYIHADAPDKPAFGAPCNGCGLCCLVEPCPIGVLISLRLRGPCRALLWSAPQGRYLCGMVSAPERFAPLSAPRLAGWVSRLARRWISANSGCDARLQAEAMPSLGQRASNSTDTD